ncbi:hypothetical protein F4777DRAFT_575441 [Nemania sp. FL0916]|nr:hypothetical protein F4777DRAFT_575441 [Nemania sp. FL0916]
MSSPMTNFVDQAKPEATAQLNAEGRTQPWKQLISSGSNGLEKRDGDFITVRTAKDADGKEVHDYQATRAL